MTTNITTRPGDCVQGFLVRAVTEVAELRSVAVLAEHVKSGARILHLANEDPENLFSISFPTPPDDDTGLPHILEHSVLGGSRRFPVRDPFFEMLKMSMATFLNAMTGADCTFYPVASNVRKDLFNLADVYFDAVFHPLLTEATFEREGHHLAPADKDNPTGALTIDGIVYNEMKGAFSDPESRLYRCSRTLVEDTIYGRESGGDPQHIPALTYVDFARFHKTFYHPSNAYVFLYGNIATEDYLAFLAERLDDFDRTEVIPAIACQPRWRTPRRVVDSYPIGKDESDKAKTFLLLTWLVGSGTDPAEALAFEVLQRVLLGHEAAPLKKAIIDSRLGQDLTFTGYWPIGLESAFAVGLKGSEPEREQAFFEVVTKTLADAAERRIDRDSVQSALQQTAYHYLEVLPAFPLHTMMRALTAWRYGGDPLTFLTLREHLGAFRERYERDPGLLAALVRERMLDNAHRLTVVLGPDRTWQEHSDAEFAQRMRQRRDEISDDAMHRIAERAEELDRLSGTPNSPEDLAKLPQLQVADLPAAPKHISTSVDPLANGVEFLTNDVFANGVNYLALNVNLEGLPEHLWPYLPRYIDAVRKMGAAGMDYEKIARRLAACTGGIGCSPVLTTHAADPGRAVWGLRFSLKMLEEQAEPALAVFGDVLFAVDPNDAARLENVVTQALAHYRTDFVHQGTATATHHAGRGLTREGYLAEIIHGLPQLPLATDIQENFTARQAELAAHIEAIRDFLLNRARWTFSFTGTGSVAETVKSAVRGWIGRAREERAGPVNLGFKPFAVPPREGLAGPIQVAHCVRLFAAPHMSCADEPLLTIGAHLLSFEYMLNEVRLKGNAYGAWCRYSAAQGTMTLGSYRDPHIARTLRVCDGAPCFVKNAQWSQTEIDRAIIAIAKGDCPPIRPAQATHEALHRHLTGETAERRNERYRGLLAATPIEVKRALLEAFDANFANSAICVVSSREKLAEANQELKEQALVVQDILT